MEEARRYFSSTTGVPRMADLLEWMVYFETGLVKKGGSVEEAGLEVSGVVVSVGEREGEEEEEEGGWWLESDR